MRPAVIFIILTVMIDAMGIGLIIPVMPDLIAQVQSADLSRAALWGGVLATTFAVMQFLFSPLVGSLSDRFGRRPVLLTSLSVMALDYVLMALAGSIWLLLLGRVIGGISAATGATASAYMADITRPEKRVAAFGMIGAGFGAGFVLGPVAGGFLAGFGTRAPFWAAAVLAAGNVIFGWIVLRETVNTRSAAPLSWRRANPLGALRALGDLPGVSRLLLVYFLYHLAFAVYPSVWSYFGKAQFGWSPAMIGGSLALFGAAMAVVQGGADPARAAPLCRTRHRADRLCLLHHHFRADRNSHMGQRDPDPDPACRTRGRDPACATGTDVSPRHPRAARRVARAAHLGIGAGDGGRPLGYDIRLCRLHQRFDPCLFCGRAFCAVDDPVGGRLGALPARAYKSRACGLT